MLNDESSESAATTAIQVSGKDHFTVWQRVCQIVENVPGLTRCRRKRVRIWLPPTDGIAVGMVASAHDGATLIH